MRITAPTYTMTPNDLFDHWLPHLGEAELKVLLVIMRKTFGWHRKRDRISISQLATLTGMMKESVINAARSLEKKGIIIREVIGEKGKQETHYELVIDDNSNKSYQSVKPSGGGGGVVGFDTLGSSDPQKKANIKENKQEKENQQQACAYVKPKAQKAEIAGGLEKEHSLIYKNTKGEAVKTSLDNIFQYFLKLPYDTDTIREAINIVRVSSDFIGNIYKYIEAVCLRIHNSKPLNIKDLKKKTDCDILDMRNQPRVNLGDLMKKNKIDIDKMKDKKNETK